MYTVTEIYSILVFCFCFGGGGGGGGGGRIRYIYSQTCIKWSPVGQRQSGFICQVTYEIFHDKTRKRWPFNTGDCLIEVTSWAGLTVVVFCLGFFL